jgi:Na+/H+ antiporter NhaD/arsenite permease-like protein
MTRVPLCSTAAPDSQRQPTLNPCAGENLKPQDTWLHFILKEWLLLASAAGLVVTSAYLNRLPSFSVAEVQVLFILLALFVAIKGLEHSGLILRLSKIIEQGKFIPLKLVITTFFLSMIVTNDIALIAIIPLTLVLNTNRKDILVILEALAANAGSALTPFGNPQNLFIYWFYGIHPETFITSIAPFSLIFLVLLVVTSLFVRTINNTILKKEVKIKYPAFIYGALSLTVILTVFRILPVLFGSIVVIYAIIFDRRSLRIDYTILLTFTCFFGLAENVKGIFASSLEHSGYVFILSALLSQIVSNVPATLLFTKFTTQWKALLWGANVGGLNRIVFQYPNWDYGSINHFQIAVAPDGSP